MDTLASFPMSQKHLQLGRLDGDWGVDFFLRVGAVEVCPYELQCYLLTFGVQEWIIIYKCGSHLCSKSWARLGMSELLGAGVGHCKGQKVFG